MSDRITLLPLELRDHCDELDDWAAVVERIGIQQTNPRLGQGLRMVAGQMRAVALDLRKRVR